MKKHLLLALGLAVSVGVSAQVATQTKAIKGIKKLKNISVADVKQSKPIMLQQPQETKVRSGINQTLIGSSYNIFTALVAESTCLTYNPDVDVILFTHRQDSDRPGHSGIVETTFSKDQGTTWSEQLVTDEAYWGRYPSGVILNPQGNTDADMAYAAVSGPIVAEENHPSLDGWIGNYWASRRFDGEHAHDTAMINDTMDITYQVMARIHAVATTDGKVRVIADSIFYTPEEQDPDPLTGYKGYVNTGVLNSTTNKIDYTLTAFETAFTRDSDSVLAAYGQTYQAWSVDGQIGYVVQLGILEKDSVPAVVNGVIENEEAYYRRALTPVVYKSTDAGQTWDTLPRMDWRGIEAFQGKHNSAIGIGRPSFSPGSGIDLTVDINGELHIACEVAEQGSDNNDSLLFSIVTNTPSFPDNPSKYLYDVHTSGNGWDAIVLDSVYVSDFSSNTYLDGTTIDSRLQIARNSDGSYIFYSWAAADHEIGLNENQYPDLRAKGLRISDGYQTNATNFTKGSAFSGENTFHFMSDMVIQDGTTFTLPITVSKPTAGDLDPMEHYYFSGVEFTDADFNSPEVLSVAKTSVENLNIFPNPTNGEMTVELTATKASEATINVVNALGQTVISEEINLGTGANRKVIDLTQVEAGIYFVNAIIDGTSNVVRVIVE